MIATDVRTITDIDWNDITFIGSGISAKVYRVAPGVVIRISDTIDERVIHRQMVMADLDLAVPVLDFSLNLRPPLAIRQLFCPAHRPRYTHPENQCWCEDPLMGILMPEADVIMASSSSFKDETTWEFIHRIRDTVAEELGFEWDGHTDNIAVYNSHRVALDFE